MTSVTIQNINLDQLHEAPNNPNHLDDKQFKLLVSAIQEVGFLQPVLVRPLAEGFEIVDGHHRAEAARKIGMVEVPAVIVKDMDDGNATAIRIGMNKLRGELDLTSVAKALKDLSEAAWSLEDLTVTGFSEGEIKDLLSAVGQNVDAAMPVELGVPDADYDAGEEEAPGKLYAMELQFENREDLKKAKRGLKRAAGKGKDLAVGLLRLIGEEKTKS